MLVRLRKSVDGWTRHQEIYEWNPGNNRWYHIHRNNIEVNGDRKQEGNLFNALYSGLLATAKGSYNLTTKRLTLKL